MSNLEKAIIENITTDEFIDEFIEKIFDNRYFFNKIIEKISNNEDYVDLIFENESLVNKINEIVDARIQVNKIPNKSDILFLNEMKTKFIYTYKEFIELSNSDIKSLYELNDPNMYKDFIEKACLDGSLKPYHLLNTHNYSVYEIFIKMINKNLTISNIFNNYDGISNNIGYVLMKEYCNKSLLSFDQILKLSGIKNMDEYYENLIETNKNISKNIILYDFMRMNLPVNYLKYINDIHEYLRTILYNYLNIHTINKNKYLNELVYFISVFQKYSYEKIPYYNALDWFNVQNKTKNIIFCDIIIKPKNIDSKNIIKMCLENIYTKPWDEKEEEKDNLSGGLMGFYTIVMDFLN